MLRLPGCPARAAERRGHRGRATGGPRGVGRQLPTRCRRHRQGPGRRPSRGWRCATRTATAPRRVTPRTTARSRRCWSPRTTATRPRVGTSGGHRAPPLQHPAREGPSGVDRGHGWAGGIDRRRRTLPRHGSVEAGGAGQGPGPRSVRAGGRGDPRRDGPQPVRCPGWHPERAGGARRTEGHRRGLGRRDPVCVVPVRERPAGGPHLRRHGRPSHAAGGSSRVANPSLLSPSPWRYPETCARAGRADVARPRTEAIEARVVARLFRWFSCARAPRCAGLILTSAASWL